MTYKGKDIGRKPTFDQLREYIKHEGLCLDAMEIYHYWEPKFWLTKKGGRVKTLESAVNVVNSIKHCKAVREKNKQKKQKSKKTSTKLPKPSKVKPVKSKPVSLPQSTPRIPRMSYEEQLQDDRWKAFREFIFAVRGHKCEKCGATTYLQVHHPKYIPGRMAWEYTCKEVKVLCRMCHAVVHGKPVS